MYIHKYENMLYLIILNSGLCRVEGGDLVHMLSGTRAGRICLVKQATEFSLLKLFSNG